jgi:hypothetical protein
VELKDGADLTGDGSIAGEVGRDEDGGGTEALGADGGHGGADPEGSCFVGGCADDGARATPGYDDRFAPKGGVIALLDGRVEGVHVDMNDFADGHLGTWYALFRFIRSSSTAVSEVRFASLAPMRVVWARALSLFMPGHIGRDDAEEAKVTFARGRWCDFIWVRRNRWAHLWRIRSI